MKVRFYNINWDTDSQTTDLPTETTLTVNTEIDISDEGADILSDEYGYCVFSFNFEILI